MNCIDGMRDIPDNFVDLIVTDPPYLVNYHTNRRKDKTHDFCTPIQNDDNPQLVADYIKECYRIMKPNTAMYMFCSDEKIDFFKQELEKYFELKNIIIWVKNNHTAGDLDAAFGKRSEFIILVNKGRSLFNGERIDNIWFFDKVSGKDQIHQNQKPLPLIKQCIEKHSKKNDIVFDGFMGSGTTAFGCIELERRFLGFELDEFYCNQSNETIKKMYSFVEVKRKEDDKNVDPW